MTPIDRADLNLLKPLAALLDERSVSRAAERVHLSQPAMSRALQRLRREFDDELLVRSGDGYRLTPAAERLRHQLAALLPQIAEVLARGGFDPAVASETFRLSGTDYAAMAIGESLFRDVLQRAPRSRLRYETWHEAVFDELERGRIDLAFYGVNPPAPLRAEALFDEPFVCVVSRDHPLAMRSGLELNDYLDAGHVVVNVARGQQGVVDADLARLGRERATRLVVPFHHAALQAVVGTELIATLPEGLVRSLMSDAITVLPAPREVGVMTYSMVWHPRLDTDPAQRWLRERVRAVVA